MIAFKNYYKQYSAKVILMVILYHDEGENCLNLPLYY